MDFQIECNIPLLDVSAIESKTPQKVMRRCQTYISNIPGRNVGGLVSRFVWWMAGCESWISL